MNEIVRFVIAIPTLNNVEDIEVTINSITNQNYNKDYVYTVCMDFGSTDGTYEKLLTYSDDRVGIYSNSETTNKRLMLAMMSRVVDFLNPSGRHCYIIVLYPGEKLYSNCLSKIAECMVKNVVYNPAFLICETDIMRADGTLYRQTPLYDDDCVISGTDEIEKFLSTGYNHQVFTAKRFLCGKRHRLYGEMNEGRWWNKCLFLAYEQNICYIHEPLICEKEIVYDDEFEEILLRWESLTCQMRLINEIYKNIDANRISVGNTNLAKYSLWRSCVLCKDGKWDDAEKCWCIADVIDKSIATTEIYAMVKNMIDSKTITNIDSIIESLEQRVEKK